MKTRILQSYKIFTKSTFLLYNSVTTHEKGNAIFVVVMTPVLWAETRPRLSRTETGMIDPIGPPISLWRPIGLLVK